MNAHQTRALDRTFPPPPVARAMKRGHSTKKIWFGCSCFWTPIGPNGASSRSIVMEFSNHTTSIAATTASNGTASSQAAPHRKNAAQRNRSDSPYQGRTAQKDNPTQLIIKQAVDFLIQQVEAGKSETLDRVSDRDGAFPQLQLWQHRCHCAAAAHGHARCGIRHMERDGPVCEARREGHPDSRADDRLPAEERRGRTEHRRGRQHQAASPC